MRDLMASVCEAGGKDDRKGLCSTADLNSRRNSFASLLRSRGLRAEEDSEEEDEDEGEDGWTVEEELGRRGERVTKEEASAEFCG